MLYALTWSYVRLIACFVRAIEIICQNNTQYKIYMLLAYFRRFWKISNYSRTPSVAYYSAGGSAAPRDRVYSHEKKRSIRLIPLFHGTKNLKNSCIFSSIARLPTKDSFKTLLFLTHESQKTFFCSKSEHQNTISSRPSSPRKVATNKLPLTIPQYKIKLMTRFGQNTIRRLTDERELIKWMFLKWNLCAPQESVVPHATV